jgi:hypothetical protein
MTPPIPLTRIVARTEGYTHAAKRSPNAWGACSAATRTLVRGFRGRGEVTCTPLTQSRCCGGPGGAAGARGGAGGNGGEPSHALPPHAGAATITAAAAAVTAAVQEARAEAGVSCAACSDAAGRCSAVPPASHQHPHPVCDKHLHAEANHPRVGCYMYGGVLRRSRGAHTPVRLQEGLAGCGSQRKIL